MFKASALAMTRPLGLSSTGLRTSKLITSVHQEGPSPTASGAGVRILMVPTEQDGGRWRSTACGQVCPWFSSYSGAKTHHDNPSHPYTPWSARDEATSLHATASTSVSFPSTWSPGHLD